MIFHPGKVIEVFSSGDKSIKSVNTSIQITLEMWDENILTFDISSKLGKTVKNNDIAIVDYSPKSDKLSLPKHEIVKILKGNKGKEMWKKYKEYLKKMKPDKTSNPSPVQVQRPNAYIG
ncbi:MAG: hypothetical protein KJ697_04490 [Nanoarchaeota archaeon]|nr:hypothetical protein [Nanoarchaeota archaeon]